MSIVTEHCWQGGNVFVSNDDDEDGCCLAVCLGSLSYDIFFVFVFRLFLPFCLQIREGGGGGWLKMVKWTKPLKKIKKKEQKNLRKDNRVEELCKKKKKMFFWCFGEKKSINKVVKLLKNAWPSRLFSVMFFIIIFHWHPKCFSGKTHKRIQTWNC